MTDTVPVAALRSYLDAYLRIAEIPDEPNAVNGLQVENTGTVRSIVAAVDASQATIDGAVGSRHGAPPLLLVHHGVFWDGNLPVTGRRFRRIKTLLNYDVALYAAHIPLDVHPEVGNNPVLARQLGLRDVAPFGEYHGIALGVVGAIDDGRDTLVARLNDLLHTNARLIPGGPAKVSRVGIITGGGGSRIGAAAEAGCDTFITGEGPHHTYFDAMEFGVNVIYAGHYATEQVGVQALAAHLAERFGLPWEFHDHPTGM